MIVTIEIPPASMQRIRRHEAAAGRGGEALGQALLAAATAGAENVREQLVRGQLDLVMRHPGSGLAASVFAWMLDAEVPLAAFGVPANTPGARYARMLEEGGTIRPRRARALAIPVSEEAKRHSSPREMPGLFMIKRAGRPPLLAERVSARRVLVHWVLVASVEIAARHWLSRGAAAAGDSMRSAFEDALNAYLAGWEGA